ncbi:MAG: DUF4236 domain-containing protein [Campylobacterota bacterium]|nr:DUF4236 domain-containing protein [Campylobacterota bacterium]
MASWLFRKRIKALPGVFVNLSRYGFGLGLGPRGVNIGLNKKGIHLNTGLPGTGIYRRDKLASWSDVKNKLNKSKKSQKISTTISKTREQNPKIFKNSTYISLDYKDKKRIIINNFTFGRSECKSSFDICNEIYTKQFSVLKDKSGVWFIQGHIVPKTAKSKDGKVYRFYPTLYNGINITNKIVPLQNNGEIEIGTVKFTITINN